MAGGSGAFAISLCQRFPQLHATIIDFPNMTAIAQRNAVDAGVGERLAVISGNAFEMEWPQQQEAVLLTPARLRSWAGAAGIAEAGVSERIAELTKVMVAVKPAGDPN